jgi:alginate O-acetyltransferase complex protein AlgI
VVLISWVFFKADTLSQALHYLRAMAGRQYGTTYYAALYLNGEVVLSLVLATLLSTRVYIWGIERIMRQLDEGRGRWLQITHQAILLCVFALSLITLVNNAYNPFIYFRF